MLNAIPQASATVTPTMDSELGMYLRVEVTWSVGDFKLDRPSTGGFGLKLKHVALAERLVRAIKAQVVFTDPRIARDVAGHSYITSGCRVLGRTINADLKRLGY